MTGISTGRSALEVGQARLAWVFLAPALAVLAVIGIYPLLSTLLVSFTTSDGGQITNDFNAGAHYLKIFRDPAIGAAFIHTAIFTVCSVSLELLIGLVTALILNTDFRGRGFVRAAVLIPWAIPTVVSAGMWRWMLNDSFGVVNDIAMRKLHLIGSPIAWTGTNHWAMLSVIAVDVWKTSPFFALLLLAGLQTIPRELYESAKVDGASALQQFFRITLPLLKPSITVVVVFRTLDALRVFDLIWVLTQGRFETESVGTLAYRQLFEFLNAGMGSAICIALFLVIFVFVVVYTRIARLEEAA